MTAEHLGVRWRAMPARSRASRVPRPPPASRLPPSDSSHLIPDAAILLRLLLSALVAILVAAVARRARTLSPRGAVAAVVVGTISLAAGLAWAMLLMTFFVLSSALSHYGEAAKAARTESIVAKGGERDAFQVLANGGIFAVAALLSMLTRWPAWAALGAGSLAAATSDTWGTEIGTLARATPRSIVSWRHVAPGTSGGITLPGTLGAIAGAACIAAAAALLGWPWRIALATFAGGLVGSTVDSLLGATIQARRWCDRCNTATERTVHRCGERTRPAGGLRWLDNDAVNVACSAAGGLVALLLIR